MTINQLLKWSNKHLIYLSFLSTGKAYAKMSTKPSALLSLKLFSTAFQNLFYYYALNAPRLSSSANRPVFVHPLSFPNCHFPFKKERNLCAVFMLSHKRLFRHYHKTYFEQALRHLCNMKMMSPHIWVHMVEKSTGMSLLLSPAFPFTKTVTFFSV